MCEKLPSLPPPPQPTLMTDPSRVTPAKRPLLLERCSPPLTPAPLTAASAAPFRPMGPNAKPAWGARGQEKREGRKRETDRMGDWAVRDIFKERERGRERQRERGGGGLERSAEAQSSMLFFSFDILRPHLAAEGEAKRLLEMLERRGGLEGHNHVGHLDQGKRGGGSRPGSARPARKIKKRRKGVVQAVSQGRPLRKSPTTTQAPTSAPAMTPKLRPKEPTAQGADHPCSVPGSLLITSPVPNLTPPTKASLAVVRKSSASA